MTPDEIRSLVRDELASLGGHLLATYGSTVQGGETLGSPNHLATLGGYLLENYSAAHQHATVAYRDPEPPAVGEPPTTTPTETPGE